MQQNQEMTRQWGASASWWEKHREAIREMFAPVTQALIENAEIIRGNSVLDVATGPGEPALTIADVVGTNGKVVGTDFVPEMIEAARREAHRRSLHHVRFEVSASENLPFAANTFDAVVSRFGIMFFPSPVDAVREWLRVLKPGGRIALAVWSYAAKNPFHSAVSQVVDDCVGPTPPLPPDAPEPFRFAEPGKLQAILSQAGVNAISERVFKFPTRVRMPVEDFWTLRYELSEKLRERIATLSQEDADKLQHQVTAAIQKYSSGGEIIFPGEVLILKGQK